ncbi:hydrolase [Aureococcus anophagefferens]|nr:hydrolase [Aureococcus anophagefferens]
MESCLKVSASTDAPSKPTDSDAAPSKPMDSDAAPSKQARPNVSPNEKPVTGMCLGAVNVLGGVGMQVSAVSQNFPKLTELVTAWTRAELPGFPFSSLQINYNYAAKKHVDSNNIGPSYIRRRRGVSVVAFSHSSYNRLDAETAADMAALGFTAGSSDGAELDYFKPFRIDKSELAGALDFCCALERFDLYNDATFAQSDAFHAHVAALPPGRVVLISITDTAMAKTRPLPRRGAAPGAASLALDKTKVILRLEGSAKRDGDGAVVIADQNEERTDITEHVLTSGAPADAAPATE